LWERRRHWDHRERTTAGWGGLTGTEQRISWLVAQGLTNRRIADQLFISVTPDLTHGSDAPPTGDDPSTLRM
jgi:DNA-binding CsgD family transcriptional regulator